VLSPSLMQVLELRAGRRPITNGVNVETSDSELVGLMARGDREAFATLFRRHQATVYRFSRQMLGSREAAEDITQEVFIALGRTVQRFDPAMGSLTTYLYGIARNLILQRHRRSRWRQVDFESLDNDIDRLAITFDPTEALAREKMRCQLRAAILRLPIHYREVVVLCELNGSSYEEAARVIGCPIGTIRSRLNRGRDMLIARCRALLATDEQRAESLEPKTRVTKRWLLAAKNNC
jgi:RNA polymerase sigma-70 factor, ECF subfamily